MKIIIPVFTLLFLFLFAGNDSFAFSKDSTAVYSKESLCKVWTLKDFKENGKSQDLYEYEIEFKLNGSYKESEEGDTEKGAWEMNEAGTAIIFDKNTLDQDEWLIVSMDAEKLIIKFSDDDKVCQFILVPEK